MRITLPNGIQVEGTQAEIEAILKSREDGEHYLSESKGLIRIDEMDTRHIGNTILKLLRKEVNGLKFINRSELLKTVTNIGKTNITLQGLVRELYGRED